MSTNASAASPIAAVPVSTRRIVHRTRGHKHGRITRLMSPSDLGQLLKPFVFLDLFDSQGSPSQGFGMHPHSGIATLTWIMEGSVSYVDTSGQTGTLPQGGVEWMMAGGGAWHSGGLSNTERVRGFQLWVALPPALESGPSESLYLAPARVQQDGPARLLMGRHGAAGSEIEAPSPMNYLAVQLKAGEHWRYQPPPGHTVGWAAIAAGALLTPENLRGGELAVFEASDQAIDFHAEADTEFMLGSAVRHPHELALGSYSVHTSTAALREGETRIQQLGMRLRNEGRLR